MLLKLSKRGDQHLKKKSFSYFKVERAKLTTIILIYTKTLKVINFTQTFGILFNILILWME